MYVSLPLPLSELIAFVVGEVHLWTDRALKAILRRASKFIPWPTAIQRSIIKEEFERNYGIPDCVGLMDGCQVNLRAQPAREDARAFHNWKNKSGLLFVAIVDCDCAFATYNSDHPALSSDHRVQLFMNVFTSIVSISALLSTSWQTLGSPLPSFASPCSPNRPDRASFAVKRPTST